MGLQGLEAYHGADSDVVASARDALKDLVKWAVQNLDKSYGGDVTYQVRGLEMWGKRTGWAGLVGGVEGRCGGSSSP